MGDFDWNEINVAMILLIYSLPEISGIDYFRISQIICILDPFEFTSKKTTLRFELNYYYLCEMGI